MQHNIVLKKLNFDLLDIIVRGVGWGSAGKLFGTMLLHFMILFNLICNMTLFQKSFNFYILTPSIGSRGGRPAIKIFTTMLLYRDFLLFGVQHDHVLKKLNFDLLTPSFRVVGEECLLTKYSRPCCSISRFLLI